MEAVRGSIVVHLELVLVHKAHDGVASNKKSNKFSHGEQYDKDESSDDDGG